MAAEPVDLEFWTAVGPARVWRYFTWPEKLSLWHGTAERFEARPGGRVCFRDPGWDPVEGIVTDVEPERLIRWQVPADIPAGLAVAAVHPGGPRRGGLAPR
jgi:uncharacterized protein YndB with AHSA1/START domain